MVGEGVLIDLSHMSERAIADTLALLDHLDPSDEVPAIFTHGAFRFGGQEYGVDEPTLRQIAGRAGWWA